ncbi:unnamed protein product [Bursaphelenchus xylophilus]|uniref:(pine wood nematode) hypothetical protein n=1 Tax=Bursaphelenchus xylophilus TaxID=6326 RepID=A0A1I7S9F4_BURXY|nr:unnamed protein product [Bursaphelenchus xylophilus]CAG9100599.1 unnamed protein product [Bursaphelenchus xylophilus]
MTTLSLAFLLTLVGFVAAAPATPVAQPNHMRSFEMPPRQPYSMMEGFQPIAVPPYKRSPYPEYINAAPVGAPALAFGPFSAPSFGPRPFEMVPPASSAFYGFRSF